MNTTKENIEIANNNSVIAFLVEQYGEKVSELLDKIQNSFWIKIFEINYEISIKDLLLFIHNIRFITIG